MLRSRLKFFSYLIFLGVLHVPLRARLIGHMAQISGLGLDILSGETLLQAKKSTGRRWDSNPGPCR